MIDRLTNSPSDQLALDIQLPDDETFASFWPIENEHLLASLKQGLNSDDGGFLYIWGPRGAGKSHLMHAAMNWCFDCHQPSSYIPLQHAQGLSPSMLDGLERMHLICLDNLQAICGVEEWELAIFDLFNRVREQGSFLVISATAAARHLDLGLPDLISRMDWGMSYQIKEPDDASKLAILQLRANIRGLVLSDDAGKFLLHRTSRDMANLWLVLDQLDSASMAAQRKLTIPFIKQVMGY